MEPFDARTREAAYRSCSTDELVKLLLAKDEQNRELREMVKVANAHVRLLEQRAVVGRARI